MNSKYRMFKNYMYNDLGIAKEDIKQWTKEAVEEVALNYIENHIDEWNVKYLMMKNKEEALRVVAREVFKSFVENNYDIELKNKK